MMESMMDWPRDRGWSWVVLIALPITVFGTEKFGCRPIVMFGGCVLFVGYLLCSIATNFGLVMFGQGFLGAIGASSIHSPSLIILGRYFDKRRGLATGIAVATGSLGGFVTPLVFTKLMEIYSIRGALLLQSAFLLHISLAAAFFRPADFTAKLYHFEKMKSLQKKSSEKVKPGDPTETLRTDTHLLTNNEEFSHEEDNGHAPPCLQPVEQISIQQKSIPSMSRQKRTRHLSNASTASQFSIAHSVMSLSIVDLHSATTTKQSNNNRERKCLNIFLQIMDVRMLRRKLVLLFTIVFCLGSIGTGLGAIFIAPMARDKNLTKDEIAITAALISGSEFVFRIITGFIADLNLVERYRIMQISLFGTGAMLLSIPLLETFWHLILFSVLFGMFSGPFLSMYAPICIDFVGLDKFHRIMGILIAFQGIVSGGLGPTIGALRDMSGSYVSAFQMMAGVTLIGGLLLFFVPCLRKQSTANETDTE
uniref:Monocarboxylate transporter 12-like isoform X2 n=1 Tax=Crassostrea virginica TaxID=6565 RepID=A0A8B8ER25_CRAVI|nr:monocarboxylate transporter 12-like isoform X2 [Crassostrea virginica]